MSLQLLIDNGVLEQDPDGFLWMNERMKDLIDTFNEETETIEGLTEKLKDGDDFQKGYWIILYLRFMNRGVHVDEVNEAANGLLMWNKAAKDNQLDEWSMKLRLS